MVGKLWFWCKILTGRADGGADVLPFAVFGVYLRWIFKKDAI